MGEDAVATIEPAIRPPDKVIERLVRVLIVPAVQEDLGRPGRPIAAGVHRDEHEIRRSSNPHAAEANLQAADQIQPFDKDPP